MSVGEGEVRQTLVGKYTGTAFLQRYWDVYVGSLTVINDLRASNSKYRMFSYGNNIVIGHTNIYLWVYSLWC